MKLYIIHMCVKRQIVYLKTYVADFNMSLLDTQFKKRIKLNIVYGLFPFPSFVKAVSGKHTWLDNKVCELATVCLSWQHWTKALVRFDGDISAFHSCVVVDQWQSLSEWHLLLSACVLVCHCDNVGA